MAFARWDPIRDLLAIHQHLDQLTTGPAGWLPPVDLFETPDAFVVTAEVPGVQREDLDIHLHEGRLTLSGVRQLPPGGCEQYHRVERGHGSFSRTFQLPGSVEADRITADLGEGVLTVTCPKASGPESRRVRVT